MSLLTEEMKETLARLSSQSIQRQRYKFDANRHPVISRSFDFDGEMITRNDGICEFIREPYQNHSIQLPKVLIDEAASFTEEQWKQLELKLDFSHLNINKMKMETLNKANQLAAKVRELQDHRNQMEKVFETEKKESKFKIAVSSQSYNTCATRQELIPAGFAKQYLTNIDKAIKSFEREIEKL